MNIIDSNKWLLVNLVNQSKLYKYIQKTISDEHNFFHSIDRFKKSENPKLREKEEVLRKTFTEKVKNEEARFRQWEQQVNQHNKFHYNQSISNLL